MKKRSLRLLALVLALVFCMSTFLACDPAEEDPFANMTEAQRAIAIYDQSNAKLETVGSYTITASINGSITAIGGAATTTIFTSGVRKQSGVGTDGYAVLSESATNVTMTLATGDPITQSSESKSGFQNGMMFEQISEDGTVVSKRSCVITAADYAIYERKYEVIDVVLTASSCTTITSVQMEDGSWLLTFTGFTTEFMTEYKDSLFAGVDTMIPEGQSLVDVRLSCIVDADLLPKQQIIEYVFANDDPTSTAVLPVLSQTETYSDYNTTVVDTVDLTGYENVGDLRQFTIYEKELINRMEASTGNFTAVMSQQVIVANATAQDQVITYSGSFTNIGAFAYTITGTTVADGESEPFSASYANGICTSGEESYASTDAEEKAKIQILLDPAEIRSGTQLVRVVAGTAPNTYVFTTEGFAESLAEDLAGATILTQSETLTVTYDTTGALVSSELLVSATLSYMGLNVTTVVALSCTYN